MGTLLGPAPVLTAALPVHSDRLASYDSIMTKNDFMPALERAAKVTAVLNPADILDEKSGFSVADLKTIMIAAEPKTIEDELNEKLGDVA
ncbi:hypothetical protein OKW76_12195 [Sphingomonas sp. S1-29]|uniref:hypothetical protein n=1 Tax=Sphingomonas sp. S1-29 TaxID=2991074 RepID=UPI002240A67D|nr:hypothetical protein [Sphingomonas sp. S1-29]UZK71171.1 hypothetical protein OKW76_12195 [Sphingomonas sp. S1-29]